MAVQPVTQFDLDPSGDVADAHRFVNRPAVLAQQRDLLAGLLVVDRDLPLPAHDLGFAQQVERPAELEQVIRHFQHIKTLQVGDGPLPGRLAALDPAHVQRLAQAPDQVLQRRLTLLSGCWRGQAVGLRVIGH